MNNPEFKRNLWLELSPQRLILMPVMLGIIAALTVYLSILGSDWGKAGNATNALLVVFAIIGALLVGAWGSFAVVGSINSEISERTWDQQRLSALSPWQMAWGKLLGSSIYPWFGGAICAAVVLASGVAASDNLPRVIILLLASILGLLALHCWLMASRLHTMDANAANNNSSLIKRLFGLYIFLQVVPGALALLFAFSDKRSDALTSWWGLPLGFSSLCLLMATLGLALGLLALWRTMSAQLMVRTIPWAWALGCTAAGLIVAGFVHGPHARLLWPAIVAGLAITATYFALFTDKNNGMVWRAVAFHTRQANWRRMLQSLPLWPVSWLLALLFTLLYSLLTGFLPEADSSADGSAFAVHTIASQLVWMCLLHALRDAGIFLFFAWRNTTRKPIGMVLLTYLVLSVILPLFFSHGSNQLALVFEPMYGINGIDFDKDAMQPGIILFPTLAWLAMLGHLAVVGVLLVWRWKQSVQLPAESSQER